MKLNRLLALTFVVSTHAAFAVEDEFSKYPTPIQAITCKDLDFNSNFRAERSQPNIIRANPNRSQPNFAGKYLLLKNELMLETEWLIADCATGKFLKERVYGQAQFKPDSTLVILFPDPSKTKSDDDDEQLPELKFFKDEEWMTTTISKPEAKPDAKGAAAAPGEKPVDKAVATLQQYEELFKNYPAPISDITCKSLDYRSNFKVQNIVIMRR